MTRAVKVAPTQRLEPLSFPLRTGLTATSTSPDPWEHLRSSDLVGTGARREPSEHDFPRRVDEGFLSRNSEAANCLLVFSKSNTKLVQRQSEGRLSVATGKWLAAEADLWGRMPVGASSKAGGESTPRGSKRNNNTNNIAGVKLVASPQDSTASAKPDSVSKMPVKAAASTKESRRTTSEDSASTGAGDQFDGDTSQNLNMATASTASCDKKKRQRGGRGQGGKVTTPVTNGIASAAGVVPAGTTVVLNPSSGSSAKKSPASATTVGSPPGLGESEELAPGSPGTGSTTTGPNPSPVLQVPGSDSGLESASEDSGDESRDLSGSKGGRPAEENGTAVAGLSV